MKRHANDDCEVVGDGVGGRQHCGIQIRCVRDDVVDEGLRRLQMGRRFDDLI